MSVQPSEQALSALEHSNSPAADLLNDAAKIIGLRSRKPGNNIESKSSGTSSFDVARFREQWVLRWLIKRLTLASNIKDESQRQNVDSWLGQRTWSLLQQLLSTIPRSVARDILVERSFCRVFDACLKSVLQSANQSTGTSKLSNYESSDHESSRPTKKRKLSPGSQPTGTLLLEKQLQSLLDVATEVGRILGSGSHQDDLNSRQAPANWVDNMEAAASLVGSLLQIADQVLKTSDEHDPDSANLVSGVLCDWLGLWQTYASGTLSSSKQDPHVAFNKYILVPALSILHHKSKGLDAALSIVLERQIAIHTILPSRATFQKRHASKWKTWTNEPAKADLMPAIQDIIKALGFAFEAFSSANGETLAALLFNIATRLVPRSDGARRKLETTWLEALFLCLSHAVSPFHSDQISGSKNAGELPSLPMKGSAMLLDALQNAAIYPSLPIFRFYVQQAILSGKSKVPYIVLAQVVSINASVFVPRNSEDSLFLGGLESLVAGDHRETADEHIQLLQDILCPIINEIGKSRQLSPFVSFLQTRLVDTFHDRASLVTESTYKGRKHIWDDPTILEAFTITCQRYAMPSMCRDMLNTVMSDLEGLPQLTGPTHQVFARIMICIQMVKAQISAPIVQEHILEHASQLRDAICAALGRSNDYQGQRWLLWKLLEVIAASGALSSLDRSLDLREVQWPLHDHTLPVTKAIWASQDRAKLMEELHCFCAISACYESKVPGADSFFEKAVSDVDLMIERHLETEAFIHDKESCWIGSVDDMSNRGTLLSAVLQRFASMPLSWLSGYQSSHHLLANIVRLTGCVTAPQTHSNRGSSCVTQSAEALLDSISNLTDIDLLNLYFETSKLGDDNQRVTRLPSFIFERAATSMNKGQAQKLAQVLFHELQDCSKQMPHAYLADYLSVLSTVVCGHSALLGKKDNFASFVACLEVPTNNASLETLASASQSISKITEAFAKRSSSTEVDDWAAMLEWAKERLTRAGSRKTGRILDHYDGFSLLAVVGSISSLKDKHRELEKQKLVSKLEKRYRETASAAVNQLCKVKSNAKRETASMDEKSAFEAWKLIEGLIRLDEGKVQQTPEAIGLLDELLRLRNPAVEIYVDLLNRLETMPKLQDVESAVVGLAGNFNLGLKSPMCCKSVALQARLAVYQQVHQGLADKKHYLKTFAGSNLDSGEHYSADSVMQNYLSVTGYIKASTTDEIVSSPELFSALGQMVTLQYGLEAQTPVTLLARLDLSRIIVESHPAMINQNIIDNTLASIAILASSASKLTLTNDSASLKPHHIYNRLCALLLTLLTRHRRRLTDRHHLLISALQNLLKCLFYPPTRAHLTTTRDTYPSKANFLNSLPHWLNPPSHTSAEILPPSSASKFSRVLQTLCDPSTSAARHTLQRHNNKSNLNLTDETRQLRAQVALHTQYLLVTYTQATLDGFIAPETKEKLLPGLYAVLNATDVEVMRGMNASMDVSQREVWKDLYAEWGRWGRWNRR